VNSATLAGWAIGIIVAGNYYNTIKTQYN
jgi:hypothetical protein